MADQVISLFHCQPTEYGVSITVGRAGRARYKIVERALRRFSRWITITASEFFRRPVVHSLCCRFRHFVRNSGLAVLRQSAVLRI